MLALALLAGVVVWTTVRLHAWPATDDMAVTLAVQSGRSPDLTAVARSVTFVGDWLTPMTIALVAWLGLVRRAWPLALLCACAMLLSAGTNELLKSLITRERPLHQVIGDIPTGWSFPSGHTQNSTVFFGLLAALVLARAIGRRARLAVLAVWLVASAAMGWSRIYLGVHWFTDTLAGFAVAVAILAVAALVWLRLGSPRPSPQPTPPSSPQPEI